MAYDETQKRITLEADASIGIYTGIPGGRGSADPNGGKQFYFVDITGVHVAGLTAAGAGGIGVLQNKPQHIGDAASVAISGVTLLVAGAILAAGDRVSSDANGAGIKTTGTNAVMGRTIIGAGPGELATVLIQAN